MLHQSSLQLLLQSSSSVPEDARTLARADVTDIKKAIDTDLKNPAVKLDRITQAHLEETRARISAALDAHVTRDLFPRILVLGS